MFIENIHRTLRKLQNAVEVHANIMCRMRLHIQQDWDVPRRNGRDKPAVAKNRRQLRTGTDIQKDREAWKRMIYVSNELSITPEQDGLVNKAVKYMQKPSTLLLYQERMDVTAY